MSGAQNEIKRAVEAGYWQMYRFNPELKKEGKNPVFDPAKFGIEDETGAWKRK